MDAMYDCLKSRNTDTVYLCYRNSFDNLSRLAINSCLDGLQLEMVRIRHDDTPSLWYMADLDDDLFTKVLDPIEGEVDTLVLYQTMYEWMIDHCDFMVTFLMDDGDIAAAIKRTAEAKGLPVINLADELMDEIITYKPS